MSTQERHPRDLTPDERLDRAADLIAKGEQHLAYGHADRTRAAAALADMHLAYVQSSSEHRTRPAAGPVGFAPQTQEATR